MAPPVYPFRSRIRWLMAGRYLHVAKALALNPGSDTLVQEKVESLVRWGRVRTVVSFLLYLGIAGGLLTYFSSKVPGLAEVAYVLEDAAAVVGAFAGILTLAFLFLTRLLAQIEADLLMLLILND